MKKKAKKEVKKAEAKKKLKMKVTVDIPPDIENLLLKKCEKAKLKPSEFVQSLLEWYFLKWRKSKIEVSGFIKIANSCALERVKYCRYSDGKHCAREVLMDIFSEKEPEPIVPYKCLFCSYFVDKRIPEAKKIERDAADQIYEIAQIAARLVYELYGEKLGYRPKIKEVEDDEITKDKVLELLENW